MDYRERQLVEEMKVIEKFANEAKDGDTLETDSTILAIRNGRLILRPKPLKCPIQYVGKFDDL